MDEVEILNEELNIIYYNAYYYRSLRPHLPNWIKLEREAVGFGLKKTKRHQSEKESESIDRILTLRKRILSFDDTCESPFQDTLEDVDNADASLFPIGSKRSNVLLEEIVEHFNDSVC